MSVTNKALDIVAQQKALDQFKKDLIEPLNHEVELSMRDISEETKKHFQLKDLVTITSSKIDICSRNVVPFDFNLVLQFGVNGSQYWFEEYVANIIRVFITAPSLNYWMGYSREATVMLRRPQSNLNKFQQECEICRSEKVCLADLGKIFADIFVIQQLLDDRIEIILSWIRERLTKYLTAPVRETKHNVRLILFARKTGDGVFGTLPLEVVQIVCRHVLNDIF
jgi:hypothetical protein